MWQFLYGFVTFFYKKGLLKNGQSGIIKINQNGQWRGEKMNETFYALPEEKRQRIINAGYRIFSQNSYKKSPVGEVAKEAGISRSLLFYYFRNKKELYLFLWDEACRVTLEALKEEKCYEPDSLFEMMDRGLAAKMKVMRKYPELTAFVMKAFYEKDPEISKTIQESYSGYLDQKAGVTIDMLHPEEFRPGLDLEMMLKEMYWATEGYLWEKIQAGTLQMDELEKDFRKMMDFWKMSYLNQGRK